MRMEMRTWIEKICGQLRKKGLAALNHHAINIIRNILLVILLTYCLFGILLLITGGR